MRARRLAFFVFFLAACSGKQTQLPPATILPTPVPTPADRFEVKAWVSESNPEPGKNVILSGSLIKNGVYLNGIMMSGYWQQPGENSPSLHCYEMTLYQRGRCNILVEGFSENVFVPLKIQFIYDNRLFTAETGFTPSTK